MCAVYKQYAYYLLSNYIFECKFQICTDLEKKTQTSIRQLNAVCTVTLVLSATGIIPNKFHDSLELLCLGPGLYILMQKTATLSACRKVLKFLAE
jgi:hypothetical protein